MDMGGLSNSSGILFRSLEKGGEQLHPFGQLSHTRIRELLLDRLESLGFSKSDFSALGQEVLLLQLKLEYQTDYS